MYSFTNYSYQSSLFNNSVNIYSFCVSNVIVCSLSIIILFNKSINLFIALFYTFSILFELLNCRQSYSSILFNLYFTLSSSIFYGNLRTIYAYFMLSHNLSSSSISIKLYSFYYFISVYNYS
jgi:hypothetical protein